MSQMLINMGLTFIKGLNDVEFEETVQKVDEIVTEERIRRGL